MRVWVEHSICPHIDDCNYEGITCCICGLAADDSRINTWDSDDTRTDEEDDDGGYMEVCVSHLNPTCSPQCREVLEAKKDPMLVVGEGL